MSKLQFHGSLRQIAEPRCLRGFIDQLFDQDWVVYAKPPFGGPDQVLNYLARYTHRVAISNYRLLELRDGQVSFLWRDYNDGGLEKTMTISAHEFLRRFLLHVLPGGLVRIRHFGLFANRRPQYQSRSLSLTTRNRYLDRSSGQPGTTLPHLLGHDAHRGATHFASTVFSAAGLATGQEVSCRHVLIRAARLRSPLQHRSGSARKRGLVFSNQLLSLEAKVFASCTREKSTRALEKYTFTGSALGHPYNREPKSAPFNSHT